MAAIWELSHRLRSLHFTQTDRTIPILFAIFSSPNCHPLFRNKIPTRNDRKTLLDLGLQIGGRNGDQRGAGAFGEEDVASRALEGRISVVLRREL